MFSFPPEFPFVSGRKPSAEPPPAAPEASASMEAQAEPEAVKEVPALPPSPPPTRPALRAKTPMVERRKAKRDSMATAALLRIDGIHGPPMRVNLIDISVAGARLHCPHPLDAGEKAQIRLEVGPLRWTTRLRVVHSAPLDDGSASVGCAFLRTELLRPWPAAA